MEKYQCIREDVRLGKEVRLGPFINLYGCTVGDHTRIGSFVEIQQGAVIGSRCKISSHTFIPSGVTIEDEVFVGHGVVFINDNYPQATTPEGDPESEEDWMHRFVRTVVHSKVRIGSNATILGGVTLHEGCLVGAGSVVTKDVPAYTLVAGNPARVIKTL